MVDYELINRTLLELQIDPDLRNLTDTERGNLLEMIDNFILSQGWDLEEFLVQEERN